MIRELFVIVLLLFVAETSSSIEITFSDMGIGDIYSGGLRITIIKANFTSEVTGKAKIITEIYASIANSSVTLEITINNDTTTIYLNNGVTKKTWSSYIERWNNLTLRIINIGIDNITIYSNSTIRLVFEETEQGGNSNSTFSPKTSNSFWLTLLILAYAIPFIVTFIYKTRVEAEEEEEELPVILG